MVRQMLHAGYERAPLPPVRQESPSETPPASPEEPAKPQSPKAQKKPAAKQRDPFFDNAKYLTIVLVGIGHAWDPLREDSRTAEALYFVLYTFHMPAFIIISGYLSRSFEGKPKQVQRLVTGVVVPYLAIQFAYTFFMRWANDDPDREFHFQEPGFALWFLCALFVWRLTTPLWKSLRWPMPVALVIGAAASVTPSIGGDLNLMRIGQFLPFFVLGLQLQPRHFQLVKRKEARYIAVPVTLCAMVFAYWAVPRMSKAWFLHDKAAADMGVPSWAGAVMYLALFGCGLVMTACFLSWVPRRHMWFTVLGAGTLYAYLLHIFFIQGSRQFDWYEMDWVDHPLSRVAITVLAAVMMTVLCTPWVTRLFKFAIEPKMGWFFKRDPGAMARKRESSSPATGSAPGSGEATRRPVSHRKR
ncbi:acyltransferase family protein [Streptomyces tubbatahanensis]|uniref:Acyltransferase family protein n=1 Tax=Streptomyces tubbatahanensis TaxID=2923272 RepID=A0ABY3XS19_9ACTN|nr:acyltransferase family protein [Streptomyces tubbatahanensis]UNS97013.1 acyltransferase family protein [Streptomyces tubbatahanensis]